MQWPYSQGALERGLPRQFLAAVGWQGVLRPPAPVLRLLLHTAGHGGTAWTACAGLVLCEDSEADAQPPGRYRQHTNAFHSLFILHTENLAHEFAVHAPTARSYALM